ncbi:uncharacterized protein LOC115462198 [Microcaecilia unicolor]|uniref:Uncharacterized protein LOC115462198 n=1 Tax=Microcaecilia unicolor TaxID=1415580 RepID=A0A6P7X6J0_9AMPH|nr:uncharacterized protein LOC115462198 [Microcaecilia unicolor]
MSGHLLPVPSSGLPRLPVIQHPLSLLGDPETISLRGFSRAPCETQSNRAPHTPEKCGPAPILAPLQHNIPEGVQVIASADPSKTRLPIFGQRADIGSRAESQVSLASSRASSISRPGTQLRIEVDELEYVFREKMRTGGYFTLRQMFKNNDPEGKGQVNRLKLNDKAIIKFEQLYAAIRDPVPSGLPAWLDPINRKQTERIMMTASQVHTQLKEKAKQSFLKFEMTFWSMGWMSGVVLGGKNFTEIKLNSSNNASSKLGGCAGALSINKRHLRGN